ncbi:hypothetical protein F2Q69_00045551 [Brassica cretica]|uniref:Zinc-ribbon domain-containing protein n=1 Tax=Brassica cretica TaxID=69181 RepID=A0A8S9NPZ7_BRACR|nr:hypothetical protein F2Q69_00045551 [Brassica cretica]
MASKSGQRVRLVKCPKCLKILQEDEDVPVYQCGGCSAILQAKRRAIAPNTTPSAGEAEGAHASEPETNNVSISSEQDTVLPPTTGHSTGQADKKALDRSLESTEKQLGDSIGEEGNENQLQEHSPSDSDKNESEDNSSRFKSDVKPVAEEAMGEGTSSGSLDAISPDASPVEEEQNEDDYFFNRHRESTDDLPANKTPSTYDGSESSSDEREELLDENEQWKALQEISSGKFQMQRYPENLKEQRRGSSSSSTTFYEKRPSNVTPTTYMERYQNRSLQLEVPGGRLGRQGRRHVTEQLRPNLPLYPREPYNTRVSPSYPSQDEFDGYSRAHSLHRPSYESVDHMYHNSTRARGRGQGSRFSGEMSNDRRNYPGWYSGSYSSYPASPQRPPMEQPPAYYPRRWSHEIVSDAEDHQRYRHAGHHHHDIQARRLKERQQRVAKRHIRPTAGGAPFVGCYKCSESLQLPVDFLIFKRKYHLLRCGRCTAVLRFSLQSRNHLVPAVVKRDINANRSSNTTSESPRDKAPSRKPEKLSSSAQEEEVPVARGSPLHRLMGYSTVSQVFKASQRPPSL